MKGSIATEDSAYIKKKAYRLLAKEKAHGKSFFARITDGVALVMSCWLLLFTLLALVTDSWAMSCVISSIVTALVAMAGARIAALSRENYISGKAVEISRELVMKNLSERKFKAALPMLRKLLLPLGLTLDENSADVGECEQCHARDTSGMLTCVFFRIPPSSKVSSCEIARLRGRSRIAIISTGTIGEAEAEFAKSIGISRVIDVASLSNGELPEELLPNEFDVAQRIVDTHAAKKKPFRGASEFDAVRARLFLTSGILLMISSLFAIAPLYYRLSAFMLFAIALFSAAKRVIPPKSDRMAMDGRHG